LSAARLIASGCSTFSIRRSDRPRPDARPAADCPADERKAATNEKIAQWKAKLEKAKLQSRADNAERYAAAAAIVAMAALDAAEQASLEAWLARKDADSAQGKAA
jgi:hypothetical protein